MITANHFLFPLCRNTRKLGYTKANLKIYKAAETVKETYSDEELLTLLELFLDYIFQEDDSNE